MIGPPPRSTLSPTPPLSRSPAEPQAVLQADAHVAAHHRRHRGDEHLVAPGAEHRPQVGVAEKAVCGALHVHHVLVMRARSEEHTSELQSQSNLVCRLLLEKK